MPSPDTPATELLSPGVAPQSFTFDQVGCVTASPRANASLLAATAGKESDVSRRKTPSPSRKTPSPSLVTAPELAGVRQASKPNRRTVPTSTEQVIKHTVPYVFKLEIEYMLWIWIRLGPKVYPDLGKIILNPGSSGSKMNLKFITIIIQFLYKMLN
jgi:hypothetical protein